MSGILQGLLAGYSFKVGSITINNGGRYASTPTGVTFSGGGGSGATASSTSTVGTQTGSVTSISGAQTGGYYTLASAAPSVSFANGGGSSATATANFGTGQVIGISGNARSTSQTGSYSFSGGGGSGAAATFSGQFARITYTGSLTITNGGSGYTSTPTVTFSGGPAVVNNYPTVSVTLSGGVVTAITITVAGDHVVDQYSDIYQFPSVSISGGGGNGATAFCGNGISVTVQDYWVSQSTNITNGGSGYTSAPSVSVPNLVAGSQTATMGRRVDSITLNTGGSGYYGSPFFSLTLSGGAAVPGFTIFHSWSASGNWYDYEFFTGFTITNGGSGYTSAPSVSVTGGSPIINASLSANMVLG